MLENLSIALFLLYFVSFYLQPVASHGYVANITIDGKVYIGNVPGAETTASVIRQVNTIDPVQPANNSNMGCGPGASPASLVASASPGSEFLIHWAGGDDQDWPHEVGPLMAYLASCGDESCTTFNTSGASWFKIHQVARVDGVWVQLDIHDGQPANLSLPSNLAPGNYILRHEIIALQNAVYIGGAEFYPSCSQLEVNGSQTGKPNSSDLVSFPGAYSETDPGIYDPDVYDTSVKYIFPGPAIASFITGSTAGFVFKRWI
ncbi:glycoside hydrolase family 61 protein [Fistulina hepatica ATCC 64428]|uniref:lytic cellulose monooxygenase (C4-dehydrogenating) n=1 Tax=Fistulina hepatica ATCC 64428 TaxID=1128425 RepID=A0A0D7AQR0_9AGAR|nr:glycoside hydrolase family 61 protein [Fistulina hepatica ATCC 64428]